MNHGCEFCSIPVEMAETSRTSKNTRQNDVIFISILIPTHSENFSQFHHTTSKIIVNKEEEQIALIEQEPTCRQIPMLQVLTTYPKVL